MRHGAIMKKYLGARITALALAIGSLATTAAHAGPMFVVNGSGILTGVNDLTVDAAVYDVSFVPGSCVSVFNPCTSNADFTFITAAGDLDAASALEAALMASPYSNDPNDILGYSPTSESHGDPLLGALKILIPFEIDSSANHTGVVSWSFAITRDQGVQGEGFLEYASNYDVSGPYANYSVYSVWTPVSVPEPATWAMLLVGLFGIGFMTRGTRHKRAVATA